MKKFKFLLMLLLTLFLFKSNSLTTYAAITDMKEIPDEYPVAKSESFYEEEKHLTKVLITEEDEGKTQKIVIPEYSYFEFISRAGKVSLYTDSGKTDKLIEGRYIRLYLPKGEYFLCLDEYFDGYKYTFKEGTIEYEEAISFLYGRVSVKKAITDSVVKKSKTFNITHNGWPGWKTAEAFGASRSSKFEYGVTYSIKSGYTDLCDPNTKFYGEDKKYRYITYDIYVKNKNSTPKVTPTGTTKKILNKEGGISDSKKKDTKKPTVKGVKNGKTYKKTVTIKVSDKSGIKKVTLNGKKMSVSKFKKGYKIKRKSTTKSYTLKVWDKAGNKRVVKFKIKKKA